MTSRSYLLAFGATWCGPCKKMIPDLKSLHSKYFGSGLEVIYINMDSDKKKWRGMIDQYNIPNWINVTDSSKLSASEMAGRFNVKALPFYLIVDRM